jgi:hypothetical protein
MVVKTLFLVVAMGATLSASDLDVYVALGMLSPQKSVSNETVDAYGQTTGQLFQPAADFKMAGLGASYTLLSVGDYRFRGNAEYATSVQNPGATLRYLAPGITTQYLEAEGTLKARSINIGVSAVYVSSGAGEYGVTLEERFETLDFNLIQALLDFPGEETLVTGRTLSKSFADPFLSVHATFVQHYESYGLFSRLSFGMDLKSPSALGTFPESAYQNLDSGLLAVLRPHQELKLALGMRF